MNRMLAATTLLLGAGTAHAQATFTITPVPSGYLEMRDPVISSDGTAIVGTAYSPNATRANTAFRWTLAGTVQLLGEPVDMGWTYGRSINGNGSVVGALGQHPEPGSPNFSLLSANGADLTYQYSGTDVGDLSDDGDLAIIFTSGLTKIVQRSTGNSADVPPPSGSGWGQILVGSMTGDGSRLTGTVLDTATNRRIATYWDVTYSPSIQFTAHTIPTLAGWNNVSVADISDDGQTIVGAVYNSSIIAPSAVRIDIPTGQTTLLPYTTGFPFNIAGAVSADGSVIVGVERAHTQDIDYVVLWAPSLGVVRLDTFLTGLGANLAGTTLLNVIAISADGRSISGNGKQGARNVAWIATIPNSVFCPGDFDNSGFVDTDDYDTFVHAFEAGGDDADVDGSGFVDTDDFDFFVQHFEAGC